VHFPTWLIRTAVIGLLVVTLSSTTPIAVAAPASAPSIIGTWKGPFLGYTFTFEFKQTDNGWTGRYQSDKNNKWADLKEITVAGDTLRFTFQSQPPSAFTLKIDTAGKMLNGSVQIGQYPTMPLNLTRAS